MSDDEDNKLEQPAAEQPAKRYPPAMGSGRIKGSQNVITKTLKTAIMESFDRVGGVEWLVKLAQDDPKTYAQLIGRVIPLQVKAEVDHTVSGIVFKTVVETRPEALSEAVVTPALIEPIEAEFVDVTSGSDDSP